MTVRCRPTRLAVAAVALLIAAPTASAAQRRPPADPAAVAKQGAVRRALERVRAEHDQAVAYRHTLELAACQPHVAGVLLFHLRDEPSLSGWQSGIRYADGSPKRSLPAVGEAVAEGTDGDLAARCRS